MKPAVSYLRRSTSKQEQSLDGQRTEICKFAAANGFKIVREYIDDGISGATGDERPQFQQMINDAMANQDFEAVLCYDLSRFGRMSADETGHYQFMFGKAGVRIVYTNENDGGNDETGELLRPMLQMQKRQILKQMSRDVLRGQIQSIRKGGISGRAAPYGLDRMLVDEKGVLQKRLKRNEKASKPREWYTTLVPSDDATEISTVREIFGTYVRNEIGCAEIARMLNDRDLPSPSGRDWCIGTIRSILKNPVYKGLIVFGRKSEGRFHRLQEGEIRATSTKDIVCNPIEKCLITPKPEIALVDENLWDAANKKLAERGCYQTRFRARPRSYPLSSLLFCADCGGGMTGMQRNGKSGNFSIYTCSSHFRNKKCHCNSVRQDRLLNVLRQVIVDRLLCAGNIDRLKAAIVKRAAERSKAADQTHLKTQLKDARAQLGKAGHNLLRADPENVPILNAAMSEIRARVVALESELASSGKYGDQTKLAEAVFTKARTTLHDLDNANGDRLKALFGEFIEKIEFRFTAAAWGRRQLREVAGCTLYLKDSLTIGYRGDTRRTFPNKYSADALITSAIAQSIDFDAVAFAEVSNL